MWRTFINKVLFHERNSLICANVYKVWDLCFLTSISTNEWKVRGHFNAVNCVNQITSMREREREREREMRMYTFNTNYNFIEDTTITSTRSKIKLINLRVNCRIVRICRTEEMTLQRMHQFQNCTMQYKYSSVIVILPRKIMKNNFHFGGFNAL
jgi:hypothetical protein